MNVDGLVTNVAEVFIDRPIAEVYRWVVYEPLENQIAETSRLPKVTSTKPLNEIAIGSAGHKRLVCLADGNTALEEHTYIETVETIEDRAYFSYKVSDYTLAIAQNIAYAIGEWWFTGGDGRTHVRWRYAFRLNDEKLLGRLGFFGRFLFKTFFIATSYNELMVSTLSKLKTDLE